MKEKQNLTFYIRAKDFSLPDYNFYSTHFFKSIIGPFSSKNGLEGPHINQESAARQVVDTLYLGICNNTQTCGTKITSIKRSFLVEASSKTKGCDNQAGSHKLLNQRSSHVRTI